MADSKTLNRDDQVNVGNRGGEAGGKSARGGRAVIDTATTRVRETAATAVGAGAKAVDQQPLGTLASAIAFGAVAAALIPATAREISTIGPVGARLRALLDEAFKAARTAGIEHLSAKGLAGAALTSGLGQNIGHLVSAALAASTAASTTVRKRERASGGQTGQDGAGQQGTAGGTAAAREAEAASTATA